MTEYAGVNLGDQARVGVVFGEVSYDVDQGFVSTVFCCTVIIIFPVVFVLVGSFTSLFKFLTRVDSRLLT